MKRIIYLFMIAILVTSCREDDQYLFNAADFRSEVDGKSTDLYTLTNGIITMQVTNYGARVVSLFVPGRDGTTDDIVLGLPSIDAYVNNSGERFLGACVGPVANRIGGATFIIDTLVCNLDKNDNEVNTLHGGFNGLDRVVWDVVEVGQSMLTLNYLKQDGEGGFPGNLNIEMTYTITDKNEFVVKYTANTDAPTYVNISHHSFFNLKGEANGTILDNEMIINADAITPVDELLIPTGEILPVDGTPFDFRESHLIGERIGVDNQQLKYGNGYDHNWVLKRTNEGTIEFACSVYEPTSGRLMEVYTDQPALQFYSGNFFDGTQIGKYGRTLNFRESIALETQGYPDSPNHSNFPSIRLDPGETYTHTCIYKFLVK